MQHHMLMMSSAHPKWHVNITTMSSTNAFGAMCMYQWGADRLEELFDINASLREEARGAPQGD